MNTSIQKPESNNSVQPSSDWFKSQGKIAAFHKPPVLFSLMMLLAGSVFLPGGTPSARAQGIPPGCTGSAIGISLFTSAPDVHIGDTLFYSASVFNGFVGNPTSCDASNIVASITTPDGVIHPIVLRRTYLSHAQSDFYTNVVSYVVRAQDVRPDATVRATAEDTAVIYQNDTPSMGGANQGVNTEVSLPCIQLAVQCAGGAGENGAITFTGTVTNCGNNTLVNVTVTNFVNGGQFQVAFITNLLRGQIASFSGSWVPMNPCIPSTATFTAQGADQFTTFPRTVTSSANTTCQNTLTPGINVTKVCPAQPVSPGQVLTFSGSVSNTGNVTLTNIAVVNNQPSPNSPVFTRSTLAPGEVVNFTGSYTAPTNCSVTDTLTATAASRCGVGVSSVASATCPILTTPQIAVTAVCPATPVLPGGSLTYGGTVRNTGNITLTNVVVVSDRPAANTTAFTVAALAPGASTNFTVTYTVPANACAVTTTFSGRGQDFCTATTVTNTISTTCAVTTAPGIAVTLACPVASATAGGVITYTGTVLNSGDVTLNNVFVVNSQPAPNMPVIGPVTLAPGASVNFTTSFTAPTDTCSVSSTVTARGNDNCTGTPVTNTASATCALITTPGIVVNQVCPLSSTIPGALLTYSGTVRNTGNITLTNVVVVNNLSGTTPVFTAATLAPGAVGNFTGSYTAPTNCSSTSISTATGRSTCGVAVTNTVSATCLILTAPQIAVTVVCPATPVLPGGSLTYNGTVRNTGNIPLTNVVVVSDRPATNMTVFTVATLAPGAAATFTSSLPVPANACSVTTTFSGRGQDICTTTTVTNTVSTTCTVTTAPGIVVALTCPAVSASAGGLITYSGTVSNPGNVILNNVTVVNNQAAPSTVLTVPSLAPGATANFTTSFTAPTDACSVSGTVSASGSDNCTGTPVTNTASATCALITTPNIVINQVCPVSPTIPGALLTYSGTVRNTGNITLTNVVVVNNLSGTTPVFTAATLAPGASTIFTGSYVTPTNCATTSVSTVTGRSICGVAVTNTVSTTCPITTTPAIVVTLACPATPPPLGGFLTYSGTVRNSGDITLTNILVLNNRTGNTPIFTAASLAPGAVASFTGSYQVPPNCCVVSSSVTASGQGCDGRVVADTASSTCPVLTSPVIVVTKACTGTPVAPGQLLTYSGSVSNAGNVSLTDVTIVNSLPTNNSPILGPVTLAPGESMGYTASYVVPPDFCGTDTVTARGTACGRTVTNSVTSSCPIMPYAPAISVTKNCPLSPPPYGGILTYTGTVKNTGNITLLNVFVVSSQPALNTPVIGPLTLAPGESTNFTASFIAPLDCCEIPTTLDARGQDKCSLTTVTARASDVCPLLATPGISINRVCPASPVPVGGLYVFTGSVSNTGNVYLTNVFVFSSQPDTNTPLLGPIELAPGETEQFTGSYTVTAGSNPATDTVMARGTDICQGRTVTATANCFGPVLPLTLTSVTFADGVATVSWVANPGTTYRLQCRNNSQDPIWIDVPGNVTATGNTASKSDRPGPIKQRFYRVAVVQE